MRERTGLQTSIVIALAVLLCACGPSPRESGSGAPAAVPLPAAPAQQLELTDACADRSEFRADLTETDDGRSLELHPGDDLCIRLPSNRA